MEQRSGKVFYRVVLDQLPLCPLSRSWRIPSVLDISLGENVSSHGECSDGLVDGQVRHGGGAGHHGHHGRRHLGSDVRTIKLICFFTVGRAVWFSVSITAVLASWLLDHNPHILVPN